MLGTDMSECEDGVGSGGAPKFSVIMPLYNKARWVRRAIESVVAQCQKDWELIVIDDGSTDGGERIVSSIRDTRIILIGQRNGGAAAARNAGIRVARGDWIVFLDADDQWTMRALTVFEEAIRRHPQVRWVAAGYASQFPDGRIVVTRFADERGSCADMPIRDALSLLAATSFCVGSVAFRKNVFEFVGFFDESLRTAEDPDMWFRIAIAFPLAAYSREVVLIYHHVPGSLMRRGDVDIDSQERLLGRYEGELQALSEERKTLVRAIIRHRINFLVVDLLLRSRGAEAKEVCERHKESIMPRKMLLYRVLMILPGSWIGALARVKAVWGRLWVARADGGFPTTGVPLEDESRRLG
jgi:hypothetical protein